MATVPTGLQICVKVLQMPFTGGGGPPWLQPKMNVTFKLASLYVLKFMATSFGFEYYHYSGHYAHRVANLCKSVTNASSRGWVDTLVATQNECNF